MALFILRLSALVASAFLSTVHCSPGNLFPTMHELQEKTPVDPADSRCRCDVIVKQTSALKTGEKIWLKRANYFYLHLDCFAWQKIWLNDTYYSMYVWYRKTEHWHIIDAVFVNQVLLETRKKRTYGNCVLSERKVCRRTTWVLKSPCHDVTQASHQVVLLQLFCVYTSPP